MTSTKSVFVSVAAVLAACTAAAAAAQTIDPARGKDPRVDYAALTRFSPWDDRNYNLTAEDLALLAPDEDEQLDPIPAFYRVLLRRELPQLRRRGPAQYPRSALNRFRLRFTGYLVDGTYYTGVERRDGRYHVRIGADAPRVAPREPELTGEARVTTPNGAAESAVDYSPVNTNLVIAGTNGPVNGQDMHYSTNGGTTWTRVIAGLPGGNTCCDPTVAWSSDGTKAYTATLGGPCCVWFYRSGNGGQTWDDLSGSPARRQLSASGATDKEYLHVDTFATSPFKDRLYMTWHESNVMRFARSTDQGNTWTTPLVFSSDPEGIGSDIVSDKSGNVYYVYPAFSQAVGGQTVRLLKSTDGGTTFGASTTIATTFGDFDWPIPAMESRRAWIYLSAAADLSTGPFANSVYVAWTDVNAPESGTPANNHTRIQLAYSRNGGATWTVVTPHPTADINTVDRFNQWLAAAPDGRLNLIYYSTQNNPSRTAVDVYHTYSNDGGQTWSTAERLTTVSSPNIVDGFEWGDYNGLSVTPGLALSIFTDNRVEGGGTGDSVDVYVAGPVAVPVKLQSLSIE